MIISEILVLIRDEHNHLRWYLPGFDAISEEEISTELLFKRSLLEQSAKDCVVKYVSDSGMWGIPMTVRAGLQKAKCFVNALGLPITNVVDYIVVQLTRKETEDGKKRNS